MKFFRNKNNIPVLIIVLSAFFFRILLLQLNLPLNYDEAVVWKVASEKLSTLLKGDFYEIQFHPPLFYILNHFYLKINQSEIFLRFPSIIYSTISLFILFNLVSKTLNTQVAFISVLLYSFLPFFLYWSIQFRVYPLLLLISLLYFYSYYLIGKSNKYVLLYVMLGVFGFSLDYSFIWVFLIINVYNFYCPVKVKLSKWIILNAVIFTSAAGYIFGFYKQTLESLQGMSMIETNNMRQVINNIVEISFFTIQPKILHHQPTLIYIYKILIFLTINLLFFRLITNFKKYLLYNLIFIIPIVGSAIINQFFPVITGKSIFISSVGVAVLFSIVIYRTITNTKVKNVILIFILISFSLSYKNFDTEPKWSLAKDIFSIKNYKNNFVFNLPSWAYQNILYYNRKYLFLLSERQIINSRSDTYVEKENIYNLLSKDSGSENKCLIIQDIINDIPVDVLRKLEKYPDKLYLGNGAYIFCK